MWKRNTARANAFRMMKYSHRSFTLETSVFGPGNFYNNEHFTPKKLNQIGYTMMAAFFLERFKPEENK